MRIDVIAQSKYSLGIEKKIWIPVTLPNIHLNKNGTAPKEEWEGQRALFPKDLLFSNLGKGEMKQKCECTSLCSSAWLNKRTLNINGCERLSLFSLFPTKEQGINPAYRFVPVGMGGKDTCC